MLTQFTQGPIKRFKSVVKEFVAVQIKMTRGRAWSVITIVHLRFPPWWYRWHTVGLRSHVEQFLLPQIACNGRKSWDKMKTKSCSPLVVFISTCSTCMYTSIRHWHCNVVGSADKTTDYSKICMAPYFHKLVLWMKDLIDLNCILAGFLQHSRLAMQCWFPHISLHTSVLLKLLNSSGSTVPSKHGLVVQGRSMCNRGIKFSNCALARWTKTQSTFSRYSVTK